MEKKTFIDKIKDMFSEVEQSNDEEVKMIYYTTKEGVEVKIPEGSELAEGTPIVVVTEEGESPAPAGEHIIEDKVITVDEAGVIVSVADVEESLKVWFAHYCRKNRTNMSTMLRFLISSLRDESYVKEEKEQE